MMPLMNNSFSKNILVMDGEIIGDMKESVLRVFDNVGYITKTLVTREDNLINNSASDKIIEIFVKTKKLYLKINRK